jgi:hypothetical protein
MNNRLPYHLSRGIAPSSSNQPNHLENYIQQLTDEIDSLFTFPYNSNPTMIFNEDITDEDNEDYREHSPNENDDFNDNLHSVIYSIREHMNAYNENTRLFLEMMNSIQQFIIELRRNPINRQRTQRTQQSSRQRQQFSQPNNRSPFRNIQRNNRGASQIPMFTPRQYTRPANQVFNAISTIFETIDPSNLQDVVVHPSQEQINQATRFINYSNRTENISSNCPITLENFEEGEQICQIIHCGHCFSETAIKNWFRFNVRCPVCRYDIRNDFFQQNTPSDLSGINQSQPNGAFRTTIERVLSNIFSQNMTNDLEMNQIRDNSGNMIYSFDIYYDGSFNTPNLDMVD